MNIQPNYQFSFNAAESSKTDCYGDTSAGRDSNGRRVVSINRTASSSSDGDVKPIVTKDKRAKKAKTPDEKREALERKRRKNGEAAMRSRNKKKQKLLNLEEQVKRATTKNESLSRENTKLKKKVVELQKNNSVFRRVVAVREGRYELLLEKPIDSENDPNLASDINALHQENNPFDNEPNYDTNFVDETIAYQVSKYSECELFPQLAQIIQERSESPTQEMSQKKES